ncbi:MAG TPA: 4Fe-4S dicluster domain-containing protein [Dehalococcoidia bacterium]|nr:4Fe-4S dicluster domain-containing protein [Dehalococcoidia bacterium]
MAKVSGCGDMSKEDTYSVLAERHGYRDSVRYRRILEYLMTPQQAELVALLPLKYEELAHRLGIDVAKVKSELENLYSRGVIFPRNPENLEEASFALAVVQLHDITMCSFDVDPVRDRELFELWDDFCVQEWDPDQVASWDRGEQPQGRIVPAYQAILDSPEILPCEDMREIIRSARSLAVTHCTCRRRKGAVGNNCDKSHSMVDIQFNISAEYLISRNAGTRLSADDALALIDDCEELGLIHTCENSTRMRPRWGMCNCCTDCCMIYQPLNRFQVPVTKCVAKSRYEARVDIDICNGCQDCADWCPFDAIEMVKTEGSKKYKASVDLEKCMGCGVCVLKCEPQALSLKLVRPAEHIPEPQF